MICDILYIKDVHVNAAEKLARKVIEVRNKKPRTYKFIVGLTGETGSGKAEIAYSLAKILKKDHIRVKILHTDNYFHVAPLLQSEWRKAKGIETVGVEEYDWILIHQNIQDFKDDRESMMPCIDNLPEQIDKLITDFKKIDLLIIEGLYAIKSDGVDLRVFIEMTNAETKLPQEKKPGEKMSDFEQNVLAMEHQHVLSLKPLCDIIINKGYQVIDEKTKTPV